MICRPKFGGKRVECSRLSPDSVPSPLAVFCFTDRAHDEDGVAGRVEQVEGPRAPLFILWRAQDVHLRTPFTVAAIGLIDLRRDTTSSTVPFHRTIEGYFDRSARYPKQSGMAVLGHLERYVEPQPVDVERLSRCEVFRWKMGMALSMISKYHFSGRRFTGEFGDRRNCP